MDDTAFKEKYKKCKLRVKLWEKDFRKRNGRVPSKHDIREAPKEIRDSYKLYYKLKTSFLEDTLNDVLDDDGFNILEMTQATDCVVDGDDELGCLSFNGGPQLPFDIAAVVNASEKETNASKHDFSNISELPSSSSLSNLINRDENHVIKNFNAVQELEANKQAWGESVSKKSPIQTRVVEPEAEFSKSARAFKTKLNSKLFKSSTSFSKRNPRKSLSRNNTETTLRDTQSSWSECAQQESLPDLETILTQKAKEQQQATAIAVKLFTINDNNPQQSLTIRTQVDEGWLGRNTKEANVEVGNVSLMETSSAFIRKAENKPKSFGISNINVLKLIPPENKLKTHTDAMNQEFDNASIAIAATNIVTEKVKTSQRFATKSQRNFINSDSDSVVSGSDEESKAEKFSQRIKRRRLLAKIDENHSVVSNNYNDNFPASIVGNKIASIDENEAVANKTENVSENVCSKKVKPKRKTAIAKRAKSNTTDGTKKASIEHKASPTGPAEDFSADENENDAYYVAEKKAKPKRKTAVAKRAKTLKAALKETKSKIEPPKRSARQTKSKQTKIAKTAEVDTISEQPPSAEELRSTLTLDGGSLIAVPRVTLNELEVADQMANHYINTNVIDIASLNGITTTRTTNKKPTIMVDEKRIAARQKLEEKIASGRLNENFVRINIEKKRYARGKKTINYSKYKKKLWRDKKRVAALIGPDMNMGGCDGGVLKCFNCGQAGHFAQNCKIKGDNLLPLSAQLAEDPSPFPTLEEAAQMATQNAMVVHSKNIRKLPQAANSAMLQKNEAAENSETSNDDNDDDDDKHKEKVGDEISVQTFKHDEHFMDIDDVDDDDEDLNNFDLDNAILNEQKQQENSTIKPFMGHKIPEDFLKKAGLDSKDVNNQNSLNKVSALYDLNEDGSVKDVTPEVMEALHMFGHTNFRKGQDRAVMRILSGLSTLVTLSTGSGKSLCYQLPAYLFSRQKKSITLVVSPLVSLMEDQVTGVPHFLRAHCLHTNQTQQQRLKVMQMISDGEVDILLVSPEAVVSGERSTGFGGILRQLPPIAFACIDEAHCVSQWSHNFRPSYLMICKVLKKNLGVSTVLGLTATATLPTRLSIIDHLGIPDGEKGIISDIPLPDNLILSISKDENRDAALLQLLNSERFENCQSIIIYCTRRDECERVAGFLRTCMQDRREPDSLKKQTKNKRKRVTWQAEPYHAGMPASRRRVIQNAFMKNELRIVVATIAFGMGINKPDIRAVIHYNMPRNFESYVQEIGRAGRDGKLSHCHLFLDARGGDQNELRRHIYANSIDRHVIRKLLQNVFVPCSCAQNAERTNINSDIESTTSSMKTNEKENLEKIRICPGHEVGFSIEATVEALDIPAENISTLLCYMELDSRWNINVLSSAYMKAKVISYGGAKYLKHAAKECPPLAMAIALEIKQKRFKEDANIVEFPVVDIAAAIGWNSGVVKHQLKNLEWVNIRGYPERSPITVQFVDLGFRIIAPGNFTSDEIDDALDTLYNRSVQQERTQLIQLQYVFQGLSSVAYNNYIPCAKEDYPLARSEQLKAIIRDYFHNDYPKDLKLEVEADTVPDEHIIDDVHAIINMYPENNFSGRTVARIFHGIASPNYPAVMWGRCKFWRAHFKSDFNRIVRLANAVIVKRRT